jgi:hypothetical protein
VVRFEGHWKRKLRIRNGARALTDEALKPPDRLNADALGVVDANKRR